MIKHFHYFHYLLLSICAVFFVGCLDAEKMRIHFDVQPDLSGMMIMEFHGIQSRQSQLQEQKKELSDFYAADYLQEGSKIAQEWSIQNAKTALSNKSDLKCDGTITGEITNLTKSLSPLLEERDAIYELKRDSKQFSFTLRKIAENEKNDIVFSMHYSGKIIENNAHRYDEGKHLMEWDLQKLDESGIHFVLETRNES